MVKQVFKKRTSYFIYTKSNFIIYLDNLVLVKRSHIVPDESLPRVQELYYHQ